MVSLILFVVLIANCLGHSEHDDNINLIVATSNAFVGREERFKYFIKTLTAIVGFNNENDVNIEFAN